MATWRIDGVKKDGTRFFAIPDFALGKPPLRIDVYIPDFTLQPPHLRDLLQSRSLFLVETVRLVVCLLPNTFREHWNWSANYPDFENQYMNLQFGSHIIVEAISSAVKNTRIHLVPTYEVERQWLGSKNL